MVATFTGLTIPLLILAGPTLLVTCANGISNSVFLYKYGFNGQRRTFLAKKKMVTNRVLPKNENFWDFQKSVEKYKKKKNNIMLIIITFWQLNEPVRSVECLKWIGSSDNFKFRVVQVCKERLQATRNKNEVLIPIKI